MQRTSMRKRVAPKTFLLSSLALMTSGVLLLGACGSPADDELGDEQSPALTEATRTSELSGRTPVLTTIAPAMGPDTGSTSLTITGKNFRAGVSVTIGGVSVGSVTIVNTTTLMVTQPTILGAFGAVAVRVTNPDGRYVERSDLFSYYSDKLAWQSLGRLQLPFSPTGGVLADLNKDGRPDLVLARDYPTTLRVMLGTASGDFAFSAEYSLATSSGYSPTLLVLDFDGDGTLDILASPVGLDTGLLLGKGDGTFQPAVSKYPGSGMSGWGNSIDVGELGIGLGTDSTPELAIGTQYSGYIMVANANGMVFPPALSIDTTLPSIQRLRVIDVNKDGKNDLLAVSNSKPAQVAVLINKGGGLFDTPRILTSTLGALDAQLGDLNSDGKIDVVISSDDAKVAVHLGNGDGSFGSATTFAAGSDPAHLLRLGDFDGDKKLDALVVSYRPGDSMTGTPNRSAFSFLAGKGDGTLATAVTTASVFAIDRVEVGDVNGDGKLDLVAATAYTSSLSVLLGLGGGKFQDRQAIPVGANPSAVQAADFNGDGKPDLAVTSFSASQVSILLGAAGRVFPTLSTLTVGKSPSALVSGDFNGDGKRDLVAANYDSNNVSLLAGNGDGTFQPHKTFATGTGPIAIAAADLNGDSKLDLVVANSDSDSLSVLLNNGAGGFASAVTIAVGKVPTSVAIGDFNGDGRIDLVSANSGGPSLSIIMQSGVTAGTFNTPKAISLSSAPTTVAVGDLNLDGKLDLAVSNIDVSLVSVLIGSGTGTFPGTPTTGAVGSLPGDLAIGDLNRDGKLDLAVNCEGSSEVRVRVGFGNGSFFPAQQTVSRAGPGTMTLTDLDQDGKLDLVLANESGGTVSLQLNATP